MDTRERLVRARVQLLSKYPFWGTLVLHLKLRENPEIHTMGINEYGELYYAKSYVDKISDEEVLICLLHEVLHCALEHLNRERVGTRNRLLWNIAADLVVNSIIARSFTIPDSWLINEEYEGKSVSQVYDILLKKKGCKLKGWDLHIILPKHDKDKHGKGKQCKRKPNWKKIFIDAYNYAKTQGNIPLGIDRLVDEYFEPKFSWKELLIHYVTSFIPIDFTYTKPSKKSISCGYYLPTVKREEIDVVVAIDTSGSISQIELREFMGETLGILKSYERVKITLMCCDTKVYNVKEVIDEYDLRRYLPKGGGGTDFRPVFRYIKEHIPNAKILVFLTDLYGSFPNKDTIPKNLKTIWVASRGARPEEPPFGICLRMK